MAASTPFIDLYSDTKSIPTTEMRHAIFNAVVGDEQKDEDPTVNELCAKVARLLGKEAAVFLPSGTMANEIALQVHCRPADEVICDKTAHIVNSEGGGPAAGAGVMIYQVDGKDGIYSADQLSQVVSRPPLRYRPRMRLVWVEQTSNMGGGTIWPLSTLNEVAAVAKRADLKLHMDGARLMNAVVATGMSAKEYAEPFDSVWIDFSKGLGCPVGAALAGSREFIQEAWRVKQRTGGSMRQAGIIAAAAVHALDHHIDRLKVDHENASALADGLEKMPGVDVWRKDTSSNIVYFDVAGTGLTATEVVKLARQNGVGLSEFGGTLMRAVTYINISRADVDTVLERMNVVLEHAKSLRNRE